MDGPQIDNGNYTRIHNEILERLALGKFTAYEHKCLWFLFRRTYGFQAKEAAISLTLWESGTGIKKRHIARTLKQLVARSVIYRQQGNGRGNITIYGFNKYFDTWSETVPVEVPHQTVPVEVPFIRETVPIEVPETVPIEVPSKERKKAAASRPPFVDAFEHYTGRLIANPYEAERITDWETRVTLEGWQSALEKTARKRPGNFWGYIETILKDYEQNGYKADTSPQQTATVDFTLEELL